MSKLNIAQKLSVLMDKITVANLYGADFKYGAKHYLT